MTQNSTLQDRLVTPVDMYIHTLGELLGMFEQYQRLGGLDPMAFAVIRATSNMEVDRKIKNYADEPAVYGLDFDRMHEHLQNKRDLLLARFEAFKKEAQEHADRQLKEAISPPFCERLDAHAKKNVVGMTPDKFIKYCISHHALIQNDLDMRGSLVDYRLATAYARAKIIATYNLHDQAPSDIHADLASLPRAFSKMADLFEDHPKVVKAHQGVAAEEFYGLLHTMKSKARELLEIREELREELGFGPSVAQNKSSLGHSNGRHIAAFNA